MHTREILQTKSVDELRTIAHSMGLTPHHRTGSPKLIESILQLSTTVQPSDIYQAPQTKPEPVAHDNTPDQILQAVSKYVQKGVKVEFLEDGSWFFSYRGREDTGSPKIPLGVIVGKCEQVAKGGYIPRIVDINGSKAMAV